VPVAREYLWRYSWSYADEFRALQTQQLLMETIRVARTNGFFNGAMLERKAQLKKLGYDKPPGSRFTLPFGTSVRWFFSNAASGDPCLLSLMRAETAKRFALAALAAKRYQLAHGAFPPELRSLVPSFLPAVPSDPVDGAVLRYQSIGAGILLHCVGDDGADNGGDPMAARMSERPEWDQGRDWVWPQPASATQIEHWQRTVAAGVDHQ
jgi:hypothetical protein